MKTHPKTGKELPFKLMWSTTERTSLPPSRLSHFSFLIQTEFDEKTEGAEGGEVQRGGEGEEGEEEAAYEEVENDVEPAPVARRESLPGRVSIFSRMGAKPARTEKEGRSEEEQEQEVGEWDEGEGEYYEEEGQDEEWGEEQEEEKELQEENKEAGDEAAIEKEGAQTVRFIPVFGSLAADENDADDDDGKEYDQQMYGEDEGGEEGDEVYEEEEEEVPLVDEEEEVTVMSAIDDGEGKEHKSSVEEDEEEAEKSEESVYEYAIEERKEPYRPPPAASAGTPISKKRPFSTLSPSSSPLSPLPTSYLRQSAAVLSSSLPGLISSSRSLSSSSYSSPAAPLPPSYSDSLRRAITAVPLPQEVRASLSLYPFPMFGLLRVII